MKLSLPGVPIGAGARPDDLGEFAPLLGAEVVAQTEVLGPEGRRSEVRPVQTDMASADVLELSWEGGIVELVPAAHLPQRFGSERGAEIVAIPLRDRRPAVGAVRGVEEFALQAVRHIRLSPRRLIQTGVLAIVRALEERAIPEPGLHSLQADGTLGERVDKAAASHELPYLVLLHGTFSDTRSSFNDLFSSPEWLQLRQGYPGRMFALEQRSLSESPAKNALDLVRALPRGAALHLLSYSRGGLIGELLCREPWQKDDPALEAFFSDPRRATQRDELTELAALLAEKSIRVERFARIACPAAGTLLASERLERYLNVVLSLLGRVSGAASPAVSFVKAIALAIAGAPAEADLFPGLEALRPQLEQGFVPFLNASPAQSGRELAVIAGDAQGGGIFERVKAFFADLYFREDNDFVVDSKSMFRGVPRREGRALYRRSPEANHYSYFTMRDTRQCAVDWLLHGQSDRLVPLSAAEDYGGLRALAARALPKSPGAPQRDGRPVVFLVPGMMGSHLALDGERIWIAILKLARGGLANLAYRFEHDEIRCDGVIESYYERLFHFLSRSHRVETFAFDWRRPLADSAQALAADVERELDQHGRPVRFMAHSMGGLVCRALVARHPALWNRIVGRGGRLVMLGTPNHGSYVPAQVLTGQHSLMGWLSRVDTKNDLEALTKIVGAFPGLLEMLPWNGAIDLLTAGAWTGLSQFRPDAGALARALEFRRELSERGVDPKHMVYVAGCASETPDRLEFAAGKVRFEYTRRGDGTVPWELGLLRGVDTYYVDAPHGQIQNHERSFEGFAELLASGATRKLERSEPLTRAPSADALVPQPPPEPELRYYPRPEDLLAHVLGTPKEADAGVVPPLTLSVLHGDVREVQSAIVVGHYRGDKLVSVEKLLDRELEGALSVRHRLEMYPGDVGTCHIEQNVIVVGLGPVGQLTRATLEQTVARGLVEYALRAAQREPLAPALALPASSLLIGTYGGTKLTVEASVEAIAEGAVRANQVLRAADSARSIRISQLTFVELYEDIATEAMYAAIDVAERSRGELVAERRLRPVLGALRSRPRSPYASGWSQRIEIRADEKSLCYHVATDLARSEPFTRPVQWSHVEPLLAEAARTDRQARAVLFHYLLPRQLVSAATRAADLVLDLDPRAAKLPWELLGPAESGVQPLGVRFGVLRQLSTPTRREEPIRSRVRRALVIGNPKNVEPSLPGAREEAVRVVELFRKNGIDVVPCIEKSADETFRDLWTGEYDFIHIAAHGEYDEKEPQNFGVVLEAGRRLTSAEFDSPTVPTLVFLNCCHLGALTREGAPKHPGQLAASVAEHLIQMGVKVVVAAGWAVSDHAAVTFARTFYDQLLCGRTLMDAVRVARKKTFEVCGANDVTWGAYQIYGHDGFILPGVPEPVSTPERAATFVSAQEFIDFISDYRSRARSAPAADLKRELAELIGSLPPDLSERGDIGHAIGMAYGSLGAYLDAIEWLTRAARSSLAPFETAEQLANYEARQAAQLPLDSARPLFARSIARLEQLIALGPSLERHSLLGASHKRYACLLAGDERKEHVKLARVHYRKAAEDADRARNGWYPALNVALLALGDDGDEPTEAELDRIIEGAAAQATPDTWTRAAQADVALVRYAFGRSGSAEAVAGLYLGAFNLGAGSLPSERESVREHVNSIRQLALASAIQARLEGVLTALGEAPPPTSEVTTTTAPRAAE